MILLIVDDQLSVVRGLQSGVDWQSLGIARVHTALNALEARAVLKQEKVDIVLCDIEMPVESGMDLFRWVKSSGYPVCFIFLTSHMDFSYAQEAIRLGAFDYVVQPAPYGEVARVVKKALDYLERERIQRVMLDYGTVFGQQKKTILGDAISSFLKGRGGDAYMESLASVGVGPRLEADCYLVLLHMIHWHENAETWEMNLLELSLENVLSEIFQTQDQAVGFAYMEKDTFAIVLQGNDGTVLPEDKVIGHLHFFASVCDQYFRCDTACYMAGPDRFAQAPTLWRQLCKGRAANVLKKSGIFTGGMVGADGMSGAWPKMKHWPSLLKDGYCDAAAREAVELLEQLCASGDMNQTVLFHFYQDYMQMLYQTAEETGLKLRDIFRTPQDMEIYQNGMKSVEQMQSLIYLTAEYFRQRQPEVDCRTLVQNAVDYIAENLEEELRRDDLAKHCHVNADHLTRVFKKEMGMSLKEYITMEKMKAAQGLLRTTTLPVSFVAAKMGYCNFSHFSYAYKKVMGRSPQEERGHEGTQAR